MAGERLPRSTAQGDLRCRRRAALRPTPALPAATPWPRPYPAAPRRGPGPAGTADRRRAGGPGRGCGRRRALHRDARQGRERRSRREPRDDHDRQGPQQGLPPRPQGLRDEAHAGPAPEARPDPAVAAIVPDTVVQLAAQSTPVGIKRVRATAAPATHIDGIDRSRDRSMPRSRSSTQASRPATPTSTCVAASTARARAARRHGPTTTAMGHMSRASPRPWTTASGSWAPHPAPACGLSACSGRTASRSSAGSSAASIG